MQRSNPHVDAVETPRPHRPRSLGSLPTALLAVALIAGCADLDQPVRPVAPPTAAAVVVAAPPTGVTGFQFLPPIGAAPPVGVQPDLSILDLLAVEICEWNGASCVLPLVRRITSTTDLPDRLRTAEDAFYRTQWTTANDGLDPQKTYRIRVLAGGAELGVADVNVLAPGEEPARDGLVRLPLNSSLSIRFTIAQGTGGRVDAAGGTVTLNSGVSLLVPAGAVSNSVFITATPATNLPPAHLPMVPGTGWDFAPDGIVFAQPVTMTIPYDPSQLPAGVNPAELRIHKLVNGTYVQQNAGRVDLANHTVSAEVNGFSVYVIIPRNPANPQDVSPPEVRALEVLDPATGLFGNAVTLTTSSSDAVLTMRATLVDDAAGVLLVDIRWTSPTGRQYRFPCYTGAPPNTGSDTNGEWICQSVMPQYAESGLWRADVVWLRDKIQNNVIYATTPNGFCTVSGPQLCIASVPQITVNSTPSDIDQPMVNAVEVSLDVQPRQFGPSVSVDAATGARVIQFGLRATDNLSGLGGYQIFDSFMLQLTGPSGQTQGLRYVSCVLTAGTNLDGFWECPMTIPAQAEAGRWELTTLRVPDRAGNGGWNGYSDWRLNGAGQLCNQVGACVTAPLVQVTSQGDAAPPDLQSVTISSAPSTATTTLAFLDNLSGVRSVVVLYRSTQSSQFQSCSAALVNGTSLNGAWECTITFSSLAAPGQWDLELYALDVAGNPRNYFRRPSDGFLCYTDPGQATVCKDFGTTDIVLQ